MHEDLRNAVLDSARHLLVQQGYGAVSMRKIADQVGCSVSSIYLYFASKDDLVHALMDEGFQRWYAVADGVRGLDLPPMDRLREHCREYVAWGLANPELYEVMYLFHPERMARYPRELFRRAKRPMDVLTDLVEACVPGAFSNPPEARHAAHVVWAILHGVVSTVITGRLDRRIDQERYIEMSVDFAIVGVGRLLPLSAV